MAKSLFTLEIYPMPGSALGKCIQHAAYISALLKVRIVFTHNGEKHIVDNGKHITRDLENQRTIKTENGPVTFNPLKANNITGL